VLLEAVYAQACLVQLGRWHCILHVVMPVRHTCSTSIDSGTATLQVLHVLHDSAEACCFLHQTGRGRGQSRVRQLGDALGGASFWFYLAPMQQHLYHG
jgi:hypothetical protein